MQVAIIGLGQIGLLYDYEQKNKDIILSHAKAFWEHPSFELVCGVDTNFEYREKFETKYHIPSYASIAEMMENHTPEIVTIATNTSTHFRVFSELAQFKLKAIFCEKPLASNFHDANKMVEVSNNKNISLIVNFKRRFDPGIQKIKEVIISNELGTVEKVVLFYGKGVLNNGSHLIDLLIYLFGMPNNYKILKVHSYNKYENDYDVDLTFFFDDFEVYMFANNHKDYTLFEMDIIGQNGRIILDAKEKETINFYKKKEHEVFSGYTFLDSNALSIKMEMDKYQFNAFNDLDKVLTENIDSVSSGENALLSLKLVDDIISSISERMLNGK